MSKDKSQRTKVMGQRTKVKMIIKLFTKNVSETHDLNNPHEKTASGCFDSEAENTRTQCGGENKPQKNCVSERRDLYLNNKLSIVH